MSDIDQGGQQSGEQEGSPQRGRSRSRSPVSERGRGGRDPDSTVGTGSENRWKEKLDAIIESGKIRREDVEQDVFDELSELKEEEAVYVVERVDALELDRVRNMSGFIRGIIRRVKTDGTEADGPGDLSLLGPDIQKQFEDLIDEGKLGKEDLDARVVSAMRRLNDWEKQEAVRRYSTSFDDTVRSKQGFLMGIIKRLGRKDRQGYSRPRGGGNYRGGGGGGRGNRYGDSRRYDDRPRRDYNDRQGDRYGGRYGDRGGPYQDNRRYDRRY